MYQLTEDQETLRQSVREWVSKELPPEYNRECDRLERPPIDKYEKFAELGYLQLGVPEEYGGMGGGIVEIAILLDELGYGMLDFAMMVYRSAIHGTQTFMTYGSEEQRRRFLPGIMSGKIKFCLSLTEPEAGSDAANVKIKASKVDGGYVIDGVKVFNSASHIAEYILLAARTDSTGPRHQGLTMFIVDTKSPGLDINHLNTLGQRAVGTNLVYYNNVFVPDENVLGGVDQGWGHLMKNLERERLAMACVTHGGSRQCVDETVAYAKERIQFGRPIGSFQVIQHKFANMAMDLHQGNLLIYDLAARIAQGIKCRTEASITKIFCTEAYRRIADECIQVMGGYGYTMDHSPQQHWRDGRIILVGAGSSEILRTSIAKDMGLK